MPSVEDFRDALATFGVPVVVGATTFFGIKDEADEQVIPGMGTHAMGRRIEVEAITTDIPMTVVPGAAITVDGDSFRVREVRRIDDGKFTIFACATGGV